MQEKDYRSGLYYLSWMTTQKTKMKGMYMLYCHLSLIPNNLYVSSYMSDRGKTVSSTHSQYSECDWIQQVGYIHVRFGRQKQSRSHFLAPLATSKQDQIGVFEAADSSPIAVRQFICSGSSKNSFVLSESQLQPYKQTMEAP